MLDAHRMTGPILVLAFLSVTVTHLLADPTRRATRLETLSITAEAGFSVTRYEVEAGVYYRWRMESDGLEEYEIIVADLFRQSWIDQVVVEGREIKPYGLHSIEFDREGAIDIWFVPLRPGTYRYYVDSLQDHGFRGEVVVR